MPKLKTHSGAKKRFNLTKTGKVKRAHAFKDVYKRQVPSFLARNAQHPLCKVFRISSCFFVKYDV